MNSFEEQLLKLTEEAETIHKEELVVQSKAKLFNEKMMGFFKEHGLPENWTFPQLAAFAIRKARVSDAAAV